MWHKTMRNNTRNLLILGRTSITENEEGHELWRFSNLSYARKRFVKVAKGWEEEDIAPSLPLTSDPKTLERTGWPTITAYPNQDKQPRQPSNYSSWQMAPHSSIQQRGREKPTTRRQTWETSHLNWWAATIAYATGAFAEAAMTSASSVSTQLSFITPFTAGNTSGNSPMTICCSDSKEAALDSSRKADFDAKMRSFVTQKRVGDSSPSAAARAAQQRKKSLTSFRNPSCASRSPLGRRDSTRDLMETEAPSGGAYGVRDRVSRIDSDNLLNWSDAVRENKKRRWAERKEGKRERYRRRRQREKV